MNLNTDVKYVRRTDASYLFLKRLMFLVDTEIVVGGSWQSVLQPSGIIFGFKAFKMHLIHACSACAFSIRGCTSPFLHVCFSFLIPLRPEVNMTSAHLVLHVSSVTCSSVLIPFGMVISCVLLFLFYSPLVLLSSIAG